MNKGKGIREAIFLIGGIAALAILGAAIDGSGTIGYYAKFTNTEEIGNGNIYDLGGKPSIENSSICTPANGECLTYNWSYGGRNRKQKKIHTKPI